MTEREEHDSDHCIMCGNQSNDLHDHICNDCISEKEQSEALRRECKQVG